MDRETNDMPEFAVGMRGYDRGQVDEYVGTLRGFLDEAHERALTAEQTLAAERARLAADQAERSATTDTMAVDPAVRAVSGLADRVADAVRASLSGAEDAGRELLQHAAGERDAASQERRRVELEAAERLRAASEQAQREAEEVHTAAQRDAERLLAQAREEQAALLSTTEEHVTSLRQRADQEQARRDDALRQMAALRTALETVAGSVPTGPLHAVALQQAVAAADAPADPLGERTTVLRLPD